MMHQAAIQIAQGTKQKYLNYWIKRSRYATDISKVCKLKGTSNLPIVAAVNNPSNTKGNQEKTSLPTFLDIIVRINLTAATTKNFSLRRVMVRIFSIALFIRKLHLQDYTHLAAVR